MSEREKEIIQIENKKHRCSEYLSYLSEFKTIEDDEQNLRAEFEVQGHIYSETSLFRILRMLDQMISLSLEGSEGFEIIQRFSDPDNLKFLIELSIDTCPRNQILIQKMFQSILKLNLPQSMLDDSVRLAKNQKHTPEQPNKVLELLDMETEVQLEGSIFLEFLFNRLAKSRKTLYTAGLNDQ